MKTTPQIMLSVVITTYNHEKYIAQCIEGAIMQKCNFRYEIIIGEDCSTDATRAICREYQKRYPEIIQLIEHSQNVGFRKNNYSVWSSARGKYIAYLEGDDFWTNEHKLQIQVDLLEQNPQFMGSGHQAFLYFENNPAKNRLFSCLEHLTEINFTQNIESWLFATNSFVFRNFFIDPKLQELQENFKKDPMFWSDRPLMVLCSLYGNFVYHSANMGCWRQHESNMTKIGSLAKMNEEGGKAYARIAKLYPVHKRKIKELVLRWYLLAAEASMKNKKYADFIKYNLWALINISSLLGLKNYVKCSCFILKGRKIY